MGTHPRHHFFYKPQMVRLPPLERIGPGGAMRVERTVKLLPVGGIKEKVLAAHRFGLKTVILPSYNEADLEDLPDEVRQSIQFIFAESVDDVLNAAMEAAPPVSAAAVEAQTGLPPTPPLPAPSADTTPNP
jgi:hypothetical protein